MTRGLRLDNSASPVAARSLPADRGGVREIEAVVKTVPCTTSAYAERLTGGYYIDIEPDRMALARGAYAQAIVDGIKEVSLLLAQHYPPRLGGRNELPDKPTLL